MDSNVTETFALRLRYALAHHNWQSRELAEKSGVSAGSVSNYTRGKIAPNIVSATMIARALGVSLDWLCGVVDTWPF